MAFAGQLQIADLNPSTPINQRTKPFDEDLLSSYSEASPSQAKRALEAHLADTDRRIQDASRLGTSLVERKKKLTERLKDVELQQDNSEMGPELKRKLAELERDYDELGRESTRASPVKPNTSVRKQRNQPGNRLHDIEFATEISTSLLGQVRQLQAQLNEKEEALKSANQENSQLVSDAEHYSLRLRGLDDNEQKFKDENWNLETQVQDLTNVIKEYATREQRLTQSLSITLAEKSSTEREYEELRQTHGQLSDDHGELQKRHDLDVSNLRRDIQDNETERDLMQKRIEELTSQNQDLARAVSYRVRKSQDPIETETLPEQEEFDEDELPGDVSPPPSPTKGGTPRPGHLESETLKSSLNHAHRMIQNLKNNIHREKTEKLELKRMLQEARDDLDSRSANHGPAAANAGRKRMPPTDMLRKRGRFEKLGMALGMGKGAHEEIIDDPAWEAIDESSPTAQKQVQKSIESSSTDVDDTGFETANESAVTAPEDTDSFHTGAESMAGDSDDDLTETDTPAPIRTRQPGNRLSFHSTASDDEEEQEFHDTPTTNYQRYKLKSGRLGSLRSSNDTPSKGDSPASVISDRSVSTVGGPNLADELQDMDTSSMAGSTPSRTAASREVTPAMSSRHGTPALDRNATIRAGSSPLKNYSPAAADSSMLSEAAASAAGANAGDASEQVQRKPLGFSFILSQDVVPVVPVVPEPALAGDKDYEAPFIPRSVIEDDDESPPRTPNRNPLRDGRTTSTFLNAILQKTHEQGEMMGLRPKNQWQSKQKERESDKASTVESPGSTHAGDRPVTPKARSADSSNYSTPGKIASPDKPVASVEKDDERTSAAGQGILASMAAAAGYLVGSSARNSETPDRARDRDGRTNSAIWVGSSEKRPVDNDFVEPTLQFGGAMGDVPSPSRPLSPSAAKALSPSRSTGHLSSTTKSPRKSMTDQGTQTLVTAEQINSFASGDLIHRNPISTYATPPRTHVASLFDRTRTMPSSIDPSALKLQKRTGTRAQPELPPLPANHREVIEAAASRTSSLVNTSAPSMPPPAFKPLPQQPTMSPPSSSQQSLNRFSSTNLSQSAIRQSMPGAARHRPASSIAASDVTRRSSVSSFASELDERFNIPGYRGAPYGGGLDASSEFGAGADPRMISAITQTMIGEFLWKYTRKTGRGAHSDNRHRRFFWIHPYTRTLYWSGHDPTGGGNKELKAKSVSIEAVRVVTDNNPMPPGLHAKSITVMTPGRSIKFTAPTAQRHETWYNALSYLLLRNGPDDQAANIRQSMSQPDLAAAPTLNLGKSNYSNTAPSMRGSRHFHSSHSNDRTSTMHSARSVVSEDGADYASVGGTPVFPIRDSSYNALSSFPRASRASFASVSSATSQRTYSLGANTSPSAFKTVTVPGRSSSLTSATSSPAVRQPHPASRAYGYSNIVAPSRLAGNPIREVEPAVETPRQSKTMTQILKPDNEDNNEDLNENDSDDELLNEGAARSRRRQAEQMTFFEALATLEAPVRPATSEGSGATSKPSDGFKKPGLPASSAHHSSTNSSSGRLSSLTSKFRPSVFGTSVENSPDSKRLRKTSRKGNSPAKGNDASEQNHSRSYSSRSVPSKSRKSLSEGTGVEGNRMENVRACCEGKHDVADLRHGEAEGHGEQLEKEKEKEKGRPSLGGRRSFSRSKFSLKGN